MPNFVFETVGSHPVTNFINTLDERFSSQPIEQLTGYEVLVGFCHLAGFVEGPTATKLLAGNDTEKSHTVLEACLQLRENLFTTLQAILTGEKPSKEIISQLEAEFKLVRAARYLACDEGIFSYQWREPENLSRPLWELALASESFLMSESLQQVKKCASDDCGVLFVDESRGGSRRWCSMANCGNRHKVRQFRAMHKPMGKEL